MEIVIANADHAKALHETGFWGRQAAGCLFLATSTGRILVSHRSGSVQEPNTWGTWGGAVDEGETPKQGVIREVKEETGYTGRFKLIPLHVFVHASGFKYHNFLAVVENEFEPHLDRETQGFKWVEFGMWPTPLHPGLAELIRSKTMYTHVQPYMR